MKAEDQKIQKKANLAILQTVVEALKIDLLDDCDKKGRKRFEISVQNGITPDYLLRKINQYRVRSDEYDAEELIRLLTEKNELTGFVPIA